MNKRIVSWLAACLLVLCTVTSLHAETGSIQGNTQLLSVPQVRTVLMVPADWRSDAVSRDLVRGFSEQPNMVALRQRGTLEVYSANSDQFKQNWAARCPEVTQGKPVVVVMDGEQKAYKRSGATSAQVNRELGGLLDKLGGNCPQCRPFRPSPSPSPKPTPAPEPDDVPQVAPLNDTQPGPALEARNPVALGLLLGAVAGVAVFISEFRGRTR